MVYSLFLKNRRQLLTIARITHVGEMVIHPSNTTSVKSHNPYMPYYIYSTSRNEGTWKIYRSTYKTEYAKQHNRNTRQGLS